MINLTADKRKEVCAISVDRGDREAELEAPTVLAVLNTPLNPGTFKSRNIIIFRDTGYDAYSLYRIDPNLHYGARNDDEIAIAGMHLENKADFIKLGDRPALVLGSLDTSAGIEQNDAIWFNQPLLLDGVASPSNYDRFVDHAPSVFSPHYSWHFDDKSWLIEKQEELQEKITYMQLEGADGFFPLPGFRDRDASVLIDLKTRFYDRIPNNNLDIRVHPTFDSVYSFFTAYATASVPAHNHINVHEPHRDPFAIPGNPYTLIGALTEDKQHLRAIDIVTIAMRRAKTAGADKDGVDKKLAQPFHPPFIVEDYLTQARFPNGPSFPVDGTTLVSDANMHIYYEEASKLILGDSFEELGRQISCAMGPFTAASIMRSGPYKTGPQPIPNDNFLQAMYTHETISDELEDLIMSSLGISIRGSKDLAVIQDGLDDASWPFGSADNRILRYSVQGFTIKMEEVKWYDLRFSNFSHILTPAQDRQGIGDMKMLNIRQLRDLITLEGPTRDTAPNDFDEDTRGVLSELGFDPDTFRSLFDEIFHSVGSAVDPYLLPDETLPEGQQDMDYIANNPFVIPRINFLDNPELVEAHNDVRLKFKIYIHQILDIGFFIPKITMQRPLLYDLIETMNLTADPIDVIGSLAQIQSDSTSFSNTRNLSGGAISARVEFFSDVYQLLDSNAGDFNSLAIENRDRAISRRLEMYKQFRTMLNDERWMSILKLKDLNEEAKIHVGTNAGIGFMALPPPFGIIAAVANVPQIVGAFDVANAQIDAFMNIFNVWRARMLQIIDALIQHEWREPNYHRGRNVTVSRGGVLKSQKQNIVFASKISESVEMNAYMVPRVLVKSVYNFFDSEENELNPDGPLVDETGEPQMKNIVRWSLAESKFVPPLYSYHTIQYSAYDRMTKQFLWRHLIKGFELQKFDEDMNLVETVSLPPAEPYTWTDVNVVYGKFYYYRIRTLWNLDAVHTERPPSAPVSPAPPGLSTDLDPPDEFGPFGGELTFDVFLDDPHEIDPGVAGGGGPFVDGLLGNIAVIVDDLEEFLNGIISPGPIVIGPTTEHPFPRNSAPGTPFTLRFPAPQITDQQTDTGNTIYNINPGYILKPGETVLRQPVGQLLIQPVQPAPAAGPGSFVQPIGEFDETLEERVDTAASEFTSEFLMGGLLNLGEFDG